jgi:hypothetical protein
VLEVLVGAIKPEKEIKTGRAERKSKAISICRWQDLYIVRPKESAKKY